MAPVTRKTLKQCGGVLLLAIITVASLLASKPIVGWEEVNKSIGSGIGNSLDVDIVALVAPKSNSNSLVILLDFPKIRKKEKLG